MKAAKKIARAMGKMYGAREPKLPEPGKVGKTVLAKRGRPKRKP